MFLAGNDAADSITDSPKESAPVCLERDERNSSLNRPSIHHLQLIPCFFRNRIQGHNLVKKGLVITQKTTKNQQSTSGRGKTSLERRKAWGERL